MSFDRNAPRSREDFLLAFKTPREIAEIMDRTRSPEELAERPSPFSLDREYDDDATEEAP